MHSNDRLSFLVRLQLLPVLLCADIPPARAHQAAEYRPSCLRPDNLRRTATTHPAASFHALARRLARRGVLIAALGLGSLAHAGLQRPTGAEDSLLGRTQATPSPTSQGATWTSTAAMPKAMPVNAWSAPAQADTCPGRVDSPGMLVLCGWICYPGNTCEYVCRNFPY